MQDSRKIVFELLQLELENLYHDIELWLRSLEERHRNQGLTDHVYEENAATLRAELVGIQDLLRDLESRHPAGDQTAVAALDSLHAILLEEIRERDFPRALEPLLQRKIAKIRTFLLDQPAFDSKKWHFQRNAEHTVLGFEIRTRLFEGKSAFQKVAVVDTYDYGHVLLLDDLIMVTDKDAFVYHEMMAHVPMAVHPDAQEVLVIGGGDGGTLTELTRYPGLRRIVQVEIDELVVDVSRKYFPKLSRGYSDPRVELRIADGVEYMAQAPDRSFDLILIDSTDPIGPGEGLFSLEFYRHCARVLREDGILINQSESPYYPKQVHELQRAVRKLRSVFRVHRVYQMFIPTYESGHWLLGFASHRRDPLALDEGRWGALGLETLYYTPEVHRASFALPPFVRDLVERT